MEVRPGTIPLATLGIIFAGLQLWWIGMTIRNDKNEKLLINQHQTAEIKKRLEKIFLSSD